MLLSKLTPAETLLIRDGDQVSVKELLKFTLMDLLLKQVLTAEEIERQSNLRDPVRKSKYVSAGKNFSQYASLRHELNFLLPFRKNSDTRMLFRNCVQIAYENAESKRALHKSIRSSPSLDGVFSVSLLQSVFGGYSYTDKGLELKTALALEMKQVGQELTVLMASDREKAMEKLKIIGGNVFLVHGLNLTVLNEIDEAFAKVQIGTEASSGGCGTWTTYNTYSDDFDSSCSADSGSSGCSSGDSGCGGGCGGD